MRDRPPSVARAARRPPAVSLDIVCCSAIDGQLAALVLRSTAARGGKPELPWVSVDPDAALGAAAQSLARNALGRAPAWMAQLGAFGEGRQHPSGAPLSVGYVAVVPTGTTAPAGTEWLPVGRARSLGPRQQSMLESALAALRDRMDLAPIAFRLLPPTFTLSELQETYELLLDRRLHKASFRRALQGAYLVEPTDEWRSEGRGRPAQLFRYAPRKRRGVRRSVRFELLG